MAIIIRATWWTTGFFWFLWEFLEFIFFKSMSNGYYY